MAKNYYGILGVPKNASDGDIKKAYRKLAMQYHPDRNPDKQEWANHRFKEINQAYAALGDPQKRRQYDQFGTVGDMGDIFSSPFTRTTFQEMMRDLGAAGLRFDFLDDVFGDLLKGKGASFSFAGFGGRPGQVRFEGRPGRGINLDDILGQTRRPEHICYELTISQAEAARGLTRILHRRGKKLEVRIPAGVTTGSVVRLRNARRICEGLPGDILIKVIVR